jgi:hypothetical protein
MPNQLTQNDFKKGFEYIKNRENMSKRYVVQAEKMYSGEQHKYLMKGIHLLRKERPDIQTDLYIVSAGYGVIPSNKRILPYECTFSDMNTKELNEWSEFLNIHSDIKNILETDYDLTVILLGEPYLKACKLNQNINIKSNTLIFCSKQSLNLLPQNNNIHYITLTNTEANRFSCSLIGLKGYLVYKLLCNLIHVFNIDNIIFEKYSCLNFYDK